MSCIRKAMALATLLMIGVGAAAEPPAAFVWIEAESSASTSFAKNPEDHPRVREVMSGGTWIGVGDPRPAGPAFLEYEVTVPQTGDYEFLARKFWHHGPFRWRFDDQPWQQVTDKQPLLDSVELWTHWCVNWVPAGMVRLERGMRRLRIELTSASGPAYFDAFILTREPFQPRGRLKPSDPHPPAPEGWFTFAPPEDDDRAAELDLRSLNERPAGASGRVRADGERLVLGDGRPVRFWAMNVAPEGVDMPRPYVDRLARYLAKRGVNLVRLHGPIYLRSGPDAGRIDRVHLDNLLYAVAAFKRQGIFSTLSIHFQHWIDLSASATFPGYAKGKFPFAIHYFDEAYQQMYRSWFAALLTTPNPHDGGRTLAGDPAVATVELLNEDSLFFWTFSPDHVPAAYLRGLERRFGAWLAARHGSLDRAMASWGGTPSPQDAIAEGRIAFLPLWRLFTTRDRRAQDTVRFLAEVQRSFYQRHKDFLATDLGYRGLVTASNWITASETYLHHVDHWTNLVGDLMDHHAYFGAERRKRSPAFGPQVGDAFADRSLLRLDPANPDKPVRNVDVSFIDYVFAGKPSMVSEWGWLGPNRFNGEAPVVVAALAAQSGMDAMVGFCIGGQPGWLPKDEGYFAAATPTQIGQHPAAALIYRLGLVAEGEPVATIRVAAEDLLALRGAPAFAGTLQDFNRADEQAKPSAAAAAAPGFDPGLFAVGPVRVEIGATTASMAIAPRAAELLDPATGMIRGSTGGFAWDTRQGVFRLTASGAQGAVGMLAAAGEIVLPDLAIRSPMETGAVVAVAMDGLPLARSARILVQVASEQRSHGARREGTPYGTIRDLGSPPIEVRAFAASVALRRPDAARLRVAALDWNGRLIRPIGTAASFAVLPDAAYYLVGAER